MSCGSAAIRFYVRTSQSPLDAIPSPPTPLVRPIFDDASANGWHVEHDTTSVGAVDLVAGLDGRELRLRYGLSAGLAGGPFVALAYDIPPGSPIGKRVALTLRAQQPMRISIQLRSGGDERQGRALAAFRFCRDRKRGPDDRLHDLTPVGSTATARPELSTIRSVLFVVDTTNTRPGASGRLWIRRAAFAD